MIRREGPAVFLAIRCPLGCESIVNTAVFRLQYCSHRTRGQGRTGCAGAARQSYQLLLQFVPPVERPRAPRGPTR